MSGSVVVPRLAALLTALALLGLSATGPVAAAPPERYDQVDFLVAGAEADGLVILANVTRDQFCRWALAGFDPSAFPQDAGVVQVREQRVGQGVVVNQLRADVPIEVWAPLDGRLDPDALCSPDVSTPVAVGHGRLVYNDNDDEVSLTRANSHGGSLNGTVWDADGRAWQVMFTVRFQVDRHDAFFVRARNVRITPTGPER